MADWIDGFLRGRTFNELIAHPDGVAAALGMLSAKEFASLFDVSEPSTRSRDVAVGSAAYREGYLTALADLRQAHIENPPANVAPEDYAAMIALGEAVLALDAAEATA